MVDVVNDFAGWCGGDFAVHIDVFSFFVAAGIDAAFFDGGGPFVCGEPIVIGGIDDGDEAFCEWDEFIGGAGRLADCRAVDDGFGAVVSAGSAQVGREKTAARAEFVDANQQGRSS